MFSRRGQYVIEYAVLIAIVTAALVAMALRFRRVVQGRVKLVDDEYSEAYESWEKAQDYSRRGGD